MLSLLVAASLIATTAEGVVSTTPNLSAHDCAEARCQALFHKSCADHDRVLATQACAADARSLRCIVRRFAPAGAPEPEPWEIVAAECRK
jgi:hypothetical protein